MKDLKLLVPLDSSRNSERTIDALIGMKQKIPGPITLLHVYDPERVSYNVGIANNLDMLREHGRKAAEAFLARKVELFTREGFRVQPLLKIGSPRTTICELADSGQFDLLIIGRHAEGEFRNLLFGQVSNFVIHRAKCPVMII